MHYSISLSTFYSFIIFITNITTRFTWTFSRIHSFQHNQKQCHMYDVCMICDSWMVFNDTILSVGWTTTGINRPCSKAAQETRPPHSCRSHCYRCPRSRRRATTHQWKGTHYRANHHNLVKRNPHQPPPPRSSTSHSLETSDAGLCR